jgi:hypothetical protein
VNRILLLVALLIALCRPAAAQGGRHAWNLGLLAGGYWLTRGESREAAGDVWPTLDLELFGHDRQGKGGLTFDLSGRWGQDGGSATVIPLTFGWWEDLTELLDEDPSQGWRSYAAARFGPFYGSAKNPAKRTSETTVGLNAHLMIGALFGRHFLAEIRYDWYTQVADLDFEGVTLQVGYLFGSAAPHKPAPEWASSGPARSSPRLSIVPPHDTITASRTGGGPLGILAPPPTEVALRWDVRSMRAD